MSARKIVPALILLPLLGALFTVGAGAEGPTCLEGDTPVAASPLETYLPLRESLSADCETFQDPTVHYLVGEDGLPYYIELTTGTGCEAADAELVHWITCWRHEPARCGVDPAPQELERVVDWGAEVTLLDEPPCSRGTEVETGDGGA